MQLSEFKAEIRKRRQQAPDVHSPRWFRNHLAPLVESGAIKHVDDFCGAQVAGATAATLHTSTNGPLMDELFAHFLWNRMHRASYWVRRFDDVYAASKQLLDSLGRMIAYGELTSCLSPGVLAHLKAAQCFARQDFAGADRLMREAPYPTYSYMSSFMLGSRTYRDVHSELDVAALHSEHEDLIEWSGLEALDGWLQQDDKVIVFSCDRTYFDRFAAHATATALAEIPDVKIVIAMVSAMGDEADVSLRDLVWSGEVPTNLEHQVAIIQGQTRRELRPMTALGRFLLAQKLHERFDCGCFVFDIDIEFLPEMTMPLLSIMDEGHLGMSFNVYGRAAFPWSKVTAAAVHIPGGNRGGFFYDVYISYVHRVMGKKNWWVDQNALFAAYSMYRSYFPAAGIANTHRLLAQGIAMTSDPRVRNFKAEANKKMRELTS